MVDISKENKQIAKKIATAFGGSPSVDRYWDDMEKSFIDLITCKNRPDEGVVSYGTVGLSNYPIIQDGKDFNIRLELLGACGSTFDIYPKILTTVAFYIINEEWFCAPNAILQNVIDMYDSSLEMKHLLFVSPFLWKDLLSITEFDTKSVVWLLAVPISEKERLYAIEHSADDLENLFEKKQIDIFNLSRLSII